MKNILLILFTFIGVLTISFASKAQSKSNKRQIQHQKALEKHYKDIVEMADNKTCVNVNDFAFAPIGAKPCGGPKNYIIYSKKIDTKKFLELLGKYNTAEFNYNQIWGLQSDCNVVPEPINIKCVDGKPVLVY
jgi:hypothetical protein